MRLKQQWDAMWSALLAGNLNGALTYFVRESQERYRAIFMDIQPLLPQAFASIEGFHLLSVANGDAEAEAVRTENGTTYSYPILYVQDNKGIWKLKGF